LSSFTNAISPYVQAELSKYRQAMEAADPAGAFTYLENAHVLGQESTYWHVKVHCLMLLWGIKTRDLNEILGQLLRILGAAALTAIKGVPEGNTGGSNVSPVHPMPTKPELAAMIAKAKAKAKARARA
jgi:hypothetical protein